MNEFFLHWVWKHRQFDFMKAKTTEGEPLMIVYPGVGNPDAGPDFLDAVIEIGGIRWYGNVEIHLRSSDWFRHRHQYDDKYNTVVLHVVYEADATVRVGESEVVPTLEMKGLILPGMVEKYRKLTTGPDILACRNYVAGLDKLLLASQQTRVLVERLMKRQTRLNELLNKCSFDWNDLIYRTLAISFGCKTNAYGFEFLSQSLPYKVVSRHLESSLQLDALLFGVAGFLNDPDGSEYMDRLKYEYEYLQYKYRLSPISRSNWNLLRLRPQNFPTVRIAQFASLLHSSGGRLQELVLQADYNALRIWLSVVPDDYWRTHYRFGKETSCHGAALGEQTVHSVIINTIVPVRFFHGTFMGDERMLEDAVALYEHLPFENNRRTRVYGGSGFPMRHAADSQALMELLQEYCSKRQCCRCSVGDRIMRDIRGEVESLS